MSVHSLKLYATLTWFSFRNHLGGWRYLLSRLGAFVFFTLVIGEFWRAIIAQGTRSFVFDRNDIIWYCGVAQLITFASSRIFARIEEDVLSGNIAYSLTRPIDYVELRLAEGIGGMSANLLFFVPIGFALCYFYTGEMPKGSIAATFIFIILGSLLHMLFQVLAGFSGVWLGEVQSPYRIYQKLMIMMGGMEIPISVYPLWVQYLSWATPIGLILSRASTAIYNPDRNELIKGGVLLFFWVVVMFAATLRGYRYVHKHIAVNGG